MNAPGVHGGGEDKSQILPEVTHVFPVPDVNHIGFGEAGAALGSTRHLATLRNRDHDQIGRPRSGNTVPNNPPR